MCARTLDGSKQSTNDSDISKHRKRVSECSREWKMKIWMQIVHRTNEMNARQTNKSFSSLFFLHWTICWLRQVSLSHSVQQTILKIISNEFFFCFFVCLEWPPSDNWTCMDLTLEVICITWISCVLNQEKKRNYACAQLDRETQFSFLFTHYAMYYINKGSIGFSVSRSYCILHCNIIIKRKGKKREHREHKFADVMLQREVISSWNWIDMLMPSSQTTVFLSSLVLWCFVYVNGFTVKMVQVSISRKCRNRMTKI